MTGNEIRQAFSRAFRESGASGPASASLVPQGTRARSSSRPECSRSNRLPRFEPTAAPRIAQLSEVPAHRRHRRGGEDRPSQHVLRECWATSPRPATTSRNRDPPSPGSWSPRSSTCGQPTLRATIHPTDDEAHDIWIRQRRNDRRARHAAGRQLVGVSAQDLAVRTLRSGGIRGPRVRLRSGGLHTSPTTVIASRVLEPGLPQYDQRGPIEGTSGEAVRRGVADGSLVR